MKWALSLLCCLSAASAAELTGGQNVYVLPMAHSLDQYIANRLTRMHVFQVVTDPAKANLILTDQVGRTLEDRLKDLYPPPPETKPEPKPEPKKAATNEKGDTPPKPPSILGDPVNKAEREGTMGVGSRGRGTIFLVDLQSREVLWSAFERPKSSAPKELDHTAERVVKQLKEDLAAKAK